MDLALLEDFEAHAGVDLEVAERQEARQQHGHRNRAWVDDDRAEVGQDARRDEGDGEEREERQRGVDRAPARARRSRDHSSKCSAG